MSAARLALVGVVIVVAAAVIAGLVITGSPQEQRMLRLDDRRLTDLQRISRTVENYYRDTEMLPAELEMIVNGWTSSGVPRDPETDMSYGYEVLSRTTYRLCADFALDSRPDLQAEFWKHADGRQCFSFDYSDIVLDR
jgi:hypothetical protein